MTKLVLSGALMGTLAVVGFAAPRQAVADEVVPAVASPAIAAPASAAPAVGEGVVAKGRGIIVLPPTELTSPPMRPLATIDVSRIPARLTLTILRQPLLERIEASVFADQF